MLSMKRILIDNGGYMSPECTLLTIEQEGLLCASGPSGSHESFAYGKTNFTWFDETEEI